MLITTSNNYLSDLDELIIACRSDVTRAYVREAVNCYRASSFRFCIVATWLAVMYDIIVKCQEMAFAGHKPSTAFLAELEKARATADPFSALKLERDLLRRATEEFELLSPVELLDLKRLYEDRNRCSHPSMVREGIPYSPTAELARAHLRNATEHLFSKEPIQGKSVIEWAMKRISSPYFPTSANEAKEFLASGPLKRPSSALLRNLVLVLVKSSVKEKPTDQIVAALGAIHLLHTDDTMNTLQGRLNDIVQHLDDRQIPNVVHLCSGFAPAWSVLSDPVRRMVKECVKGAFSSGELDVIRASLVVPELSEIAAGSMYSLSAVQLGSVLMVRDNGVVIKHVIERLGHAANYAEANDLVDRVLFPVVGEFDSSTVVKLLHAVGCQDQAFYAFRVRSLMVALVARDAVFSEEEVAAWQLIREKLSGSSDREELAQQITESLQSRAGSGLGVDSGL